MKNKGSKRGIISIAFIFILIITVILAAMISIFWSKAQLSSSRLKRFHAINYAEVALNEAVKRFHQRDRGLADYLAPGSSQTWNIDWWLANSYSEDINIENVRTGATNVPITISVVNETINGVTRKKISATVQYDNIEL